MSLETEIAKNSFYYTIRNFVWRDIDHEVPERWRSNDRYSSSSILDFLEFGGLKKLLNAWMPEFSAHSPLKLKY